MSRFLSALFLMLSVTGIFAQTNLPDIPTLLDRNKNDLGISTADMAEYVISSAYTTAHLNVTHVYLEQKYKDIRVFNGILNLNLIGDRVISFGNRWITDIGNKAPSQIPEITSSSAVERSADHLGHLFSNPVELSKEQNKLGQEIKYAYAPGNLSREEIKTELVWLKGEQKEVFLCWIVEIHELENENIWLVFIDAHTGAFIRKDNLVLHCDFGTPDNAIRQNQKLSTPASAPLAMMPPTPDSSYNVFAMPVESPIHGARSIVTRPWLAAGVGDPATTLRWHNNGTTNYTSTRGNNVHAYDDINSDNAPGVSPDTFNLRFDYPFTPSITPTDNLKSCITNLFYWNNIIHDVAYQYGFDEVSGNFQNSNLGRGGLGNDYVKAEAQDGGGTNNANFNTPVDGSSGRMQMYVWSPVSETSPLTINTPPSIAGSMYAIESAFSTNNKLATIGLTTGDLLLIQDESGPTHQACGTISNGASLPGKIAVIDRGTCDFVTKVKAVQNLGAVAAIVINNVAGAPFAMSGTDNTIVIPAVMISLSDGDALKAAMIEESVNASLDAVDAITPDGDFDSGIITHEYGHGISTRLTGGPANSNCLNNREQMGEGWSDFFGLMLTTDWQTAASTDPRGIGTYVLGQSTEGTGIRTYPYTIDTMVNPFTYADISNAPLNSSGVPSVHYIGSVWCTMLWEMTWSIIAMEGVDPDMYDGDGGNNIAMQLVIDGLKLQPCSPGFVDGRNAILLADELNYGGIHKCAIWNAFARRGLGVNASQGSSNVHNDGVESYAIPSGVSTNNTTNAALPLDGQEVTFNVKATCQCANVGDLTVADVLSPDLIYVPGSGGTLIGNKVQFSLDTINALDSVTFTYHAIVRPCSATSTVNISTDNAETPDQYHTVKISGSGTRQWVKNTTLFVSPTRSWYGQDYNVAADFVLLLNNAVPMTGGPVEISFNHRYATEATWDGGVVEYSFNNGTTWIDAGPLFTEHGYPSAISGNSGTSIAGRQAFTGTSDTQFNTNTFIHSTIRVLPGAATTLLVRFRFVCDANTAGPGINGWYIDDILINQLSGLTNQNRVTIGGILKDSTYYTLQTSIFTAPKIYVDKMASGQLDGTTWPNAMRELSVAATLAGCRTADSVLVAQGVYLPNLTNSRLTSFTIPSGTSVYGGFPTGGGTFAQRNPVNYLTRLSGDIGVAGNNSDNVYHVIKIDSAAQNALLDGVTLSYGNANGTGDNGQGAAVFCRGGLTMQNVFMNNSTGLTNGQLIRNRSVSANLKLTDCKLYGPNDNFTKVLNTNSAQLTILGNTMFLKE